MPDPEFGKVIKEGNKKFRDCVTKKCKMSYKEALRNKTNKCRQSCVAEVCAFVVSRLREELKKCKDSDDPTKCRENGEKLIRSYSSAYKKVTGETLGEGALRMALDKEMKLIKDKKIQKQKQRLRREEFIQPIGSKTFLESF